jgi:hypothetical protein
MDLPMNLSGLAALNAVKIASLRNDLDLLYIFIKRGIVKILISILH